MSADVLRVGCLPAGHGDCVLVEYRPSGDRTRVLLDAGPANAYKSVSAALTRLKPDQRRFAPLIGAILLLQDDKLGLEFDEVWFNGWPQLARLDGEPPDVFCAHTGRVRRGAPHRARHPVERDATQRDFINWVCDCRHGAPSLGVHDGPLSDATPATCT